MTRLHFILIYIAFFAIFCLLFSFFSSIVDVLLLLIPTQSGNQNIMTGKVFEYMSTGKPILALVPEGEAAGILREAGVGHIVNPLDETAVAEQIQTLASRRQQGTLKPEPNWQVIHQFDRKRLTEKLTEVMNEVKASVKST